MLCTPGPGQARQLAWLVASLARFNFFTSWARSLARCFNEPTRASSRAAHELKQAETYQSTTMNPEDNDADLEVYTYSIDM